MNKFRSAILNGAGVAPPTPLVSEKVGAKAQGDRLDSIAIARDTGRSSDHRDEDRHRLARETATIHYRNKTLEVDLINLSGGGAMIESDLSPRLWDRIDLFLGEGSAIECAVRWLRNGRIGLEFAHETRIECAPEMRDALLIDVIRRSFPDVIATPQPVVPEPAPEPAPVPALGNQPLDKSRRGDRRHPLIWNGVIFWQHDEHKVRLRNISASGVLIDSQIGFPHGAEIMLDLGDSGQYFATVGWSRGGQAGLAFNRPFDLSVLASIRPEVAPQRSNSPSYLDLTSGQSSPWAEGWERRELSDLASDLEGFLKY